MKFIVFALLVPSVFALTESVFDENKRDSYSTRAVVKTFQVDNDIVRVSILNLGTEDESPSRETYELCSQFRSTGGDGNSLSELTRMQTIQQAFGEGRVVRINFNGLFDRCIERVVLEI